MGAAREISTLTKEGQVHIGTLTLGQFALFGVRCDSLKRVTGRSLGRPSANSAGSSGVRGTVHARRTRLSARAHGQAVAKHALPRSAHGRSVGELRVFQWGASRPGRFLEFFQSGASRPWRFLEFFQWGASRPGRFLEFFQWGASRPGRFLEFAVPAGDGPKRVIPML